MKSRSEATQGSPNKFGWLAKGMLHRFKSHQNSLPYPANRVAFCASAALAAGQKFDSAQDDVQGFCFAIIRAQRRATNGRPYKRCFAVAARLFIFIFCGGIYS